MTASLCHDLRILGQYFHTIKALKSKSHRVESLLSSMIVITQHNSRSHERVVHITRLSIHKLRDYHYTNKVKTNKT